ncbi:hypothetical protein B0J14DRAFT_314808 [Halenospora varia]|nr:hypothetical protein B0J14DRAFT_314808 [Halenospora varia]
MVHLQSPFMSLPSEIRLEIYKLLFNDKGNKVLEVRNEDPDLYKRRAAPLHRTSYRVIGRDLVRQSLLTTYKLLTDTDMHTSIIAVNRKIYEETTHFLYGRHTFSFGRDVEAVVPFFADLTRQSRPLVSEISLIKQGSVYSRDYDRCEWSNMCEFLRNDMQLESLKLVVEGGRPALGWDGLPEYSAKDFKTLSSVRYEALDWVWDLLSVKGLRNLEVTSTVHHIPPSHSSAMAFFAAFSASIESGFTEFLRSELLVNL